MSPRSASKPTPVDPFAEDIFAAGNGEASPQSSIDSRTNERSVRDDWQASLPRVTNEQARSSANACRLPLPFSVEPVVRLLARYTQTPADRISISCIDLREQDSSGGLSDAGTRIYACLASAPTGKPLAVSLDAGFAIALVDQMLGGEGAGPDDLRQLSRVEAAVVEFLCLGLCRELNEDAGASVISLARMAQEPPDWLAGGSSSLSDDASRRMVASLVVTLGPTRGLIAVHFPASALFEIGDALARAGASEAAGTLHQRSRIKTFGDVTVDVCLSIMLGRSEVTVEEISNLEPGDVLLIGDPYVHWLNGGFEGSLKLRVGDGENSIIRGKAAQSTVEVGEGECGIGTTIGTGVKEPSVLQTTRLLIEGVSSQHSTTMAERFDMNEEAREEQLGNGAALLEGLLLNVHVELRTQRLRMDELAQLRIGQIIDLGCRASDPVDLLIDGRTIARGQLVDIEGRLGVTITHVAM